ncbi:hypothetical protein PIROE2DRAFT_20144 [Piromyces sp. E2]|nr:hypothetical protein PIROE2DRAFT_20144 [Piromyces sp. E2]|eukprot:OUM66653.1 hypothetical protein PIROE2DRAFT_20144 [Piromyces sp. E2]
MDIINNIIDGIRTGISFIITPNINSSENEYTNLSSKVTSRINKRGCYYHCKNDDISLFGLITVCIFGVLVFSFILYLFILLIMGCCRRKKNRIDIEVEECDTIETEYEPPTGEQTAGNQIEQQNYNSQQGCYYPPPPPGYYPPPPSFSPYGAPKTFRRGPAFPQYYYYVPYYQPQGRSRPHPHPHPHPHPRPMSPPPSTFYQQPPNEPLPDNDDPPFPSQTNLYNEETTSPTDNNGNNKTEAGINTVNNSSEVAVNTGSNEVAINTEEKTEN